MRTSARGFTLIELVIAMTVFSLISVALYGVVALGASAAGAGERKTEQARRFRTAVGVMVRQLRSTAPMYVAGDEDEDREARPYFLGEEDSLEFVTAAPQGPYAAGLALVRYWIDEGQLRFAETPYFLAYDKDGLEKDAPALTLEATLLYDVKSVVFEYQRSEYEEDKWEETWDAADEDALPAGVRITVEPETPDGPALEYEIPLFVAVYNEITGEDDFRESRQHAPAAPVDNGDQDDDDTGADDDTGDDDAGDEEMDPEE